MESGFRIFLLRLAAAAAVALLALPAYAQNEDDDEDEDFALDGQVVDPQLDRRRIREAEIDTEDFEVGIFAGGISIEDFDVNPVYGVRFAYHITEDFFVEAAAGRSEAGETSFEELSGGAQLLTDDERVFTYYNVSIGYNVLPGEMFFGGRRAFNTALYLIGGVGSTDFAGDERFTVNVGLGYRIMPVDYLAFHVDLRDHLFDIDLLGENKTAHNIEAHVGVTFFF